MAATRAEVCASAIADAFAEDGEIFASPMGLLPTLGVRLAKLTSNPDLLISDGESLFLGGVPPLGERADVVEGWIPFRRVFDVVAWGKRHVMMGATQVDRHGNQNISAIGDFDKPKRQLLGSRGAPGNTVNNRTSYWIPKHSTRTFVEQVVDTAGLTVDTPVQRLLLSRMLVDGVVETPNGAHFTTCTPDYERDEGFQKAYATAAGGTDEEWQTFHDRFLAGDEAAYQAAVRAFGEEQ